MPSRTPLIWAIGDFEFDEASGITVVPDRPRQSLSDADIILRGFQKPVPSERTHRESPEYPEDNKQFEIEVAVRRRELAMALESGKTVFVEISDPLSVRAFRRNGYNSHEAMWGYSILPIDSPALDPRTGKHLSIASGVLPEIRKAIEPLCALGEYEALFSCRAPWIPLLTTRTDERCASAYARIGTGHLVLLPRLPYFHETGAEDHARASAQFAATLRTIDRVLRAEEEVEERPQWASNPVWETPVVTQLRAERAAIENKIENLHRARALLIANQSDAEGTLDLVTASGTRLERAVRRALRSFGIETIPYQDADTGVDFDLMGDCLQVRIVGEVEGKDTRAIDNEKSQQLGTSYTLYVASQDATLDVRPFLFGNPERLTEPDKRSKSFTDLCRKILPHGTFVLTSSLFLPTQYLEANPGDEEYKTACQQALISSVGKIVQFPDPPSSEHSLTTPST